MQLIHPNAANLVFNTLDDKICPICIDKDNHMDFDTCYILECTHVFHKDCIKGWLYCNATCPTCRYKVKHIQVVNIDMYEKIIENISDIRIYNDDKQLSLLEYAVYNNNINMVKTILYTDFESIDYIDDIMSHSVKNCYIEIFELLIKYCRSKNYYEYVIYSDVMEYIISKKYIEMIKKIIKMDYSMLSNHMIELSKLDNVGIIFYYLQECFNDNYDNYDNIFLAMVTIICNNKIGEVDYFSKLLNYTIEKKYDIWEYLLLDDYIFDKVSDEKLFIIIKKIFENIHVIDYNNLYLRCIQKKKNEVAKFLHDNGCIIIW